MSTSIVTASCQLNDGSTVDLYTSMTESTDATSTSELLTSTAYAVSATSIGTFANGKSITAFTQPVTGTNNIVFAYLERRGAILMILPIATRGVQSVPCMPYANITLQAGETIVRHFGTQSSASNLKNTSGGVYVLNDRGLPAGSCGLTVLSNLQPTPNAMAGATVGLNFVARVTTSA